MIYMKPLLLVLLVSMITATIHAQNCNPGGNEATYGTNNVWIGYVYKNKNLNNYIGYVTEGNSSSPNFDQNFGGDDVNYATSGCTQQTSNFSVRYRLRKTFTSGTYQFIVGADDGFRLSFDGGSTWAINRWNDQGYTTETYTVALNGTYNMVLEYYESGGANRVSFSVTSICMGTGNTATYGTGNVWNGYAYDGTNFETYVGMVTEGTSSNPDFDQSFGGSNVQYNTSSCGTQTETFSMRYRRTQNFSNGTYRFVVGGDDGYRFSIDGGATWLIDNWNLHSYTTTTSNTVSMSGSYNLVLEYYENSGDNRVSFAQQTLTLLPVSVEALTAVVKGDKVELNWLLSANSTPKFFEVEKSADGMSFKSVGTVKSNSNWSVLNYSFTDAAINEGVSYYRLKITDADGIISYSKITTVNIKVTASKSINIFPTVVTASNFYIKSASNIRNAVVMIADFSGRIIVKQSIGNVTAGQPVQVNANALTNGKGMYTVSVTGSETNFFAGKIVVQ